jgi:hypothetical protein
MSASVRTMSSARSSSLRPRPKRATGPLAPGATMGVDIARTSVRRGADMSRTL